MGIVEVISLAYSRKEGGKCFAGLKTDGSGWIRPIQNNTDYGEIKPTTCQLNTGKSPALLNVIQFEVSRAVGNSVHPEDYLLVDSPWKLVRESPTSEDLEMIQRFMINGPNIFGNAENSLAGNCNVDSSLAIVRPTDCKFLVKKKWGGKKQARMTFSLMGQIWDLPLTDGRLEDEVRKLSLGVHNIQSIEELSRTTSPTLTLSLGVPCPNDGRCYKLIAAVIP